MNVIDGTDLCFLLPDTESETTAGRMVVVAIATMRDLHRVAEVAIVVLATEVNSPSPRPAFTYF